MFRRDQIVRALARLAELLRDQHTQGEIGDALRATLLAESPGPFRERNLFVSANALSRA